MRYAIMRMNKLKGLGATARSLQHNFREVETPNADMERSTANIHSVSGTDEALGLLRRRLESLDRKVRKDAVTCVEYLMTASPEWFASADQDQKDAFFEGSREWLEDKYGKENIVSFSIHQDETTPHIAAHVAPITKDGRLSAKELIGAKKQMQEDQTSFAAKHEHIGLERGVMGSKAVHQDIKAYYASVNKAKNEEMRVKERFYQSIPEKKMFENPKSHKKRIAESLNEEFKDLREKASMTTEIARTEERSKRVLVDVQNQNNMLRDQNKQLRQEKNDDMFKLDLMRDALIKAAGGREEARDIIKSMQKERAFKEQEQKKRRREKERSQGLGFSR